jgi:hypothetical protein
MSVHMSYVKCKPSMVRFSYCMEDTSGYNPVSNAFCKFAEILHRLKNMGKLVRLLILRIMKSFFGGEIHGRMKE